MADKSGGTGGRGGNGGGGGRDDHEAEKPRQCEGDTAVVKDVLRRQPSGSDIHAKNKIAAGIMPFKREMPRSWLWPENPGDTTSMAWRRRMPW